MTRCSIVLSGVAVAVFLSFGVAAGRAETASSGAADPNVVGMDHSKLNHGVLGPETPKRAASEAAASSGAVDPNVVGMDHSKLNHGVLGPEAPRGADDHARAASHAAALSVVAEDHAKSNRGLTAALRYLGKALDSAQIGDTDGIARHAEDAIQQAALSEKATPSQHKTQGIAHLTAAVREGRKNNLDAAQKHVEEALLHLKEA